MGEERGDWDVGWFFGSRKGGMNGLIFRGFFGERERERERE